MQYLFEDFALDPDRRELTRHAEAVPIGPWWCSRAQLTEWGARAHALVAAAPDQELLAGVPPIPPGDKMDGQFFPLLFRPR